MSKNLDGSTTGSKRPPSGIRSRPGSVPHRGPEGDAERLCEIVHRFRGRRVAVLGDLVSDEFVHGDIARISREAPVLILEHRKTVTVPGGAGNAIANLAALDAVPLPVGLVGRDESGARLRDELERLEIDDRGVLTVRGFETPSKSRVLAGGVHTRRQQIVRIDRGGRRGNLSPSVQARLDRALRRALPRAEGLLVADYGYGAATPERLAALEPRAAPVFIDSRSRVADYRGATACTPNQEELERALDLDPVEDDTAVEEAGRRLQRRTGSRAVLVTRGARGMLLIERGRPAIQIPAFGSDEVADVTGAGDTVIAVFTLAMLSGADFVEAARLSNYAAGIVVMKAGTATVSASELSAAIREDFRA